MTFFGPPFERMMANAAQKAKARQDAAARQAMRESGAIERRRALREVEERQRAEAAREARGRIREPGAHTLVEIERRICRALNVTRTELRSPRRSRDLVLARQAVCYWCCRLTTKSLPQIGRMLNRDHTSVLHNRNVYPVKRAKMGRTLRAVR